LVALDVRDQELVAVIGLPRDVTETLVGLALPPEVAPVILLGNDSDRSAYGDYQSVPGLRSSLLDGLEDSGRLARGVRLSARSLSVLRSARRYRRTKVTHDVRLVKLFDVLAHSRKLVIAGTDWPADAAPGREWWRVLATMLVARAMKVPVLVAVGTVPNDIGARDTLVRWSVARLSSPIDESVPTQPALRPDTPLAPEPTHAEISVESGDSVAAVR
jgi:hypothetical protein